MASTAPNPKPGPKPGRPSIAECMLLVVGVAVGLAFVRLAIRDGIERDPFTVWTFFLGGLSLVGVPILLLARRQRRRRGQLSPRFGPGQLLWFSTGTAAWLLFPPVILRQKAQPTEFLPNGASALCFAYGTPLMALYVTAALLCGGHLRRRRRRRRARRSWTEVFGLLLGMLWAISGLYILFLLYAEDVRSLFR